MAIEVFDEPDVAAAKHRGGLRRLFALQMRDALKYLEKNIPDLQKMAVAYMPLGTLEELREQIIEVALDRAFLLEPLPADAADFQRRLDEGRGRLTLIANEVARLPPPSWPSTRRPRARSRTRGTSRKPPPTRPAAAAPGAQALPGRDALGPAAAPAALPEGDRVAARQAAGGPGARCRPAGRAEAAGAALLAPRRRAQGAPPTSAWRTSAGCWRNCA